MRSNQFLLLLTFLYLGLLPAQTPTLATFEVQGDGLASPYVGQTILLDTSVVTYARSGLAYVQALKGDNDPATSDGLQLSEGNLLSLVPGDLVVISGRVSEEDRMTRLVGPFSINKVGAAPLPAAVALNADTAYSPVPFYERYEGMRVAFDLGVGQGTTGFGSVRVHPTEDRPFREPGLEPPGIDGLPRWDGNPEILSYDPNGLGEANATLINAGDRLRGIGVLEEFSFGYELSPVEAVDRTETEVIVRPVRPVASGELTVGSLNTLFLLDEEDNYGVHLVKVVNYVAEVLQFPTVIALQEIGGQDEVEDLVFRLRQIDPERGDYRGFAGSGTGSLRCGYLVHRSVDDPRAEELGTAEFLSSGGILHDRPPLLLHFPVPGDPDTRLQVLNLHLRSLNGIDNVSDFVRRKRHEQAVSVARMVENLRNDNLVIVGDYNAFEFSDGYVDVMAQIAGTPSLGALIPVQPIVSPPLSILSETLVPAEDRYSFVFRGSAQMLDHCLANELTGLTVNELAYGRGNADASVNYFGQAFQLPRASDHDGFVLYLGVDALTDNREFAFPEARLRFPNPAGVDGQLTWEGIPAGSIMGLFNAGGQRVATWELGTADGLLRIPPVKPGTYVWRITQGRQIVLTAKMIAR